MFRAIILAIAIPFLLVAQQGFHLDPIVSTEGDGLFDAAGEKSTTIDISIGSGSYSATFAVQAFASAGTTACTYNVKGSLKDSPSSTDFVDLPTPTALSCLTTNDERLHFFRSRQVRTLEITLATLTGGTGVVFAIMGMAK